MKKLNFTFIALITLLQGLYVTAQNPFGVTGVINDQSLGLLDDRSVIFPSYSGFGNDQGFMIDPDTCLTNYLYDLYIPSNYDGTESYGLVIWINSGNNGAVKNIWKPVLDEKKLIWIGVNGCGNSVYTYLRLSAAWAGALRIQELLNIDPDRIYTSGSSGGGRVANTLAYIYPEVIDASTPLCGASFPLTVPQDYETQNPNSNYEQILPFSASAMNYIKGFDQKFCIMTSFDDFREGDIMNIYHGGHQPAQLHSKFLDHPGNHCATTTEEFRDAISFVESNFYQSISSTWLQDENQLNDHFHNEQTTYNIGTVANTITLNDQGLIKSKHFVPWIDRSGADFNVKASISNNNGSTTNHTLQLGLWGIDQTNDYCDLQGDLSNSDNSGILLQFHNQNDQVQVQLYLTGINGSSVLLYTGDLIDWNPVDEIHVKFHLWEREMRIELNHHLNTGGQVADPAIKVLDDNRSIQLKWNSFSGIDNAWFNEWQNGALLTCRNEKINTSQETGKVSIYDIYAYSNELGSNVILPQLSISENNQTLIGTTGFTDYQWYYNGNLLVDSTNHIIQPELTGSYLLEAMDSYGCIHNEEVYFQSTLGSMDLSKNKIKHYPNPAEDLLTIKYQESIHEFQLISVDGRIISFGDINCIGINTYQLDLSKVEQGWYTLIINPKSKPISLPILKK